MATPRAPGAQHTLLPLHAGLSRDNWAYIAYALTAVTAVIFLLTMVMLRRISVAVACIKVCKSTPGLSLQRLNLNRDASTMLLGMLH